MTADEEMKKASDDEKLRESIVKTVNDNAIQKAKKQQTLSAAFERSDVKAWRKHLEKEGFVVLKGVLPKKDVEQAKKMVFDWLKSLKSGIRGDDAKTWKNAVWPK